MDKKRLNVNVDHGEHSFFTDNVTISHGPNKFVVDFSQTTPRFDNISGQMQQTMFIRHNAVMMDPGMAKIFLQTLMNNIKAYEKKFGKINIPKTKKARAAKKSIKAKSIETSSRYIG
jgi:hypothetical protein